MDLHLQPPPPSVLTPLSMCLSRTPVHFNRLAWLPHAVVCFMRLEVSYKNETPFPSSVYRMGFPHW